MKHNLRQCNLFSAAMAQSTISAGISPDNRFRRERKMREKSKRERERGKKESDRPEYSSVTATPRALPVETNWLQRHAHVSQRE